MALALYDAGSEETARDGRRDEIVLALARYRASDGLDENDVDELIEEIGRVEATAASADGIAEQVSEYLASFEALGAGDREDVSPDISAAWDEFPDGDGNLEDLAEAIRANLEAETASVDPDPSLEIASAPEGKILASAHIRRERSRPLRQAKIRSVHGQPVCEACGFDFQVAYGDRGAGFIECHHLKPLHELRPGDETTLEDLALLCANCHRMIHSARPWLTVVDLRELVGRNR